VQSYLKGFVDKAVGLSVTMSLAVIATALLMIHTLERALNRIFDTRSTTRFTRKLMMYWAVLTLGPLLIGGGIALSTLLFKNAALASMKGMLVEFLPLISSGVAFFLIYLVVPNRKIKWKHALIGALFAAVCFELAKQGFAWYVKTIPSYQQVYGALATIPLFLIWMFLSWNIILLGGTVTATLETSRWRLHVQQYHTDQRLLLVLDLLSQLKQASQQGKTVSHRAINERHSFVPDDELSAQLTWLQSQQYITTDHQGDYLLQHDTQTVTFRQLYGTGGFKIPVKASPRFAHFQPLLDRYWQPAAGLLDDSLEHIINDHQNT